MLGPIGQIALHVASADRAQAFYGDALGLKLLFRFGDLLFYDCGGVRLMLQGVAGAPQPTNGVCHYFKVGRIEPAVAAMKNRGVFFDDEPHLVARMPDHELWMTFFKDPDGHQWGLMEERRGG